MRILEYGSLDTAGLEAQYRKVSDAIASGDFRAADVKKLDGLGTQRASTSRSMDRGAPSPQQPG